MIFNQFDTIVPVGLKKKKKKNGFLEKVLPYTWTNHQNRPHVAKEYPGDCMKNGKRHKNPQSGRRIHSVASKSLKCHENRQSGDKIPQNLPSGVKMH